MRHQDWEKRLAAYLSQVGLFEWGQNDCCLFAANGVLAMTGVDYAQPYRGYTTAKEALRLLGDDGVEGVAIKAWGEPKPPAMAKRGDPVLVDLGDDIALGLCVGAKIAAVGPHGLVMLPMKKAVKAWSV